MEEKKMDEGLIIRVLQEAVFYIILVSAPALGISIIVGLIISIFQTATAIQEQTLTFVPKILATLATLAIVGAWMLRTLADFATRLFSLFPQI